MTYDNATFTRAICAAASEQRWSDIETILEQRARLYAATQALAPLLDDFTDPEARRELQERGQLDALEAQWIELKPELPSDGSAWDDDTFSRAWTIWRDVRRLKTRLEVPAVVSSLEALEADMRGALEDESAEEMVAYSRALASDPLLAARGAQEEALDIESVKSAEIRPSALTGTKLAGVVYDRCGTEFDVRLTNDGWVVNDDGGTDFTASSLTAALTKAINFNNG